jgi:hypothetical protein
MFKTTYMCKDVSASEQQPEQKRLLYEEDASSSAGTTHEVWHIGGKHNVVWKVRKEDKEEGNEEESQEEEVKGERAPLFSGRSFDMVKKKTSKKAGKAAKKRGYYMGKEVRAAKSR